MKLLTLNKKDMKRLIVLVGTLLAVVTLFAQGEVTVTIEEVESTKGNVYFNLFSSPDGFPSEWDNVFQQGKIKAQKGNATYTFKDVPLGTYAVSVAHDENDNGEIDTNFIGFPKEPVGASNQEGMGKPSFRRSRFEVTSDKPVVKLEMKFLN